MVIKIGSRGPQVRRLQLSLQAHSGGRAQPAADGVFGPKTVLAVKRFQQRSGLEPDGVVGPDTWKALGQVPDGPIAVSAQDAGAPWMTIAKAELGVREYSKAGRDNARIVQYHRATLNLSSRYTAKDETAWCSSFVNWVMAQSGYKGTQHALASSWLNWERGTALSKPRYGAITVIKRRNKSSDAATGSRTGYHVAFFVSTTPSRITLLGGNQANRVKYSRFNLAAYNVEAYIWPKVKPAERMEFLLAPNYMVA